MTNIGLFLEKNFKNKHVELYTGDESDYIHYNDTDTFNRAIICGIFVSYDKDSGVITLVDTVGTKFFISESAIQMFWEPGFNILTCTKTTMNTGKQWIKKKRDFMK